MDVEKVIEEIKNKKEKSHRTLLSVFMSKDWNRGFDAGLITAINVIKSNQDKVVWPKYVAEAWEKANAKGDNLKASLIIMLYGQVCGEEADAWLENDENMKIFLQGVLYGYTVEKEKKYQVRIPEFSYGTVPQFLTFDIGNNEYYASTYGAFRQEKQLFTEEELKSAPEWVQDLPREEAEDDE